MSIKLAKLKVLRLRSQDNLEKLAHYVPGKTKAPVPFVRNHDYIGGTFYHGPMSQHKSVDEYRKKAEPPVEIWRKDPKEKKKYKDKRKNLKKKRKGARPAKRMKRIAELAFFKNNVRKNRPYIEHDAGQLRKAAWVNRDNLVELKTILSESEKRPDLILFRDVKRSFTAALFKRAREERPYFNSSSAQLRDLIMKNKDNVDELRNILHELSLRSSMAARAMMARVKDLIKNKENIPAVEPEQLPLPMEQPKVRVIEPEVLPPEDITPTPEPEPKKEEKVDWRNAKADIPDEDYKTQFEAVVATKDLPEFGLFGHVRQFLRGQKIREVTVLFHDAVDHLGAAWADHERIDVTAFDEGGQIGGWDGSYGGSGAMMYSDNKATRAAGGKINTTIPPNHAILEVRRAWEGRYVNRATLHVNTANQASLLPEGDKMDEAKKNRLIDVASVFSGYISAARPEQLYKMKVTQEELDELVDMDIIKCAKGKRPQVTGTSPRHVGYGKGAYNSPFKYPYDLARARLTVKGKNFVIQGKK